MDEVRPIMWEILERLDEESIYRNPWIWENKLNNYGEEGEQAINKLRRDKLINQKHQEGQDRYRINNEGTQALNQFKLRNSLKSNIEVNKKLIEKQNISSAVESVFTFALLLGTLTQVLIGVLQLNPEHPTWRWFIVFFSAFTLFVMLVAFSINKRNLQNAIYSVLPFLEPNWKDYEE